ncbi:MAG: TIGR00730 family Rossman fold protein [Pseudomonadota bacterium]
MQKIPKRKVCVYCGSSVGANQNYQAGAEVFAKALAQANIGLVYGGGDVGLMGVMARHVLEYSGHVTGIIPEFLCRKEILKADVQELIITCDMHERKKLMFEKADGFVALPGGIGTLEELVEQLTWAQLGQHTKPVCLANFDGFWTPFLDLIDHMRAQNFIRSGLDFKVHVIDKAEDIVPTIEELMDAALPYKLDKLAFDKL